ncbi:cupin-like domain-containing protein [Paraburkholderia azotifigens]|uniref:Cupin-like domain-containing protein n=1 Tax=Paraburkholderia azotifigens TaxID=2057004 RepID=A0A5C6VPB0_9BURK|nr:cupin-like domain-containing protein [Paraburkholderia azotifigens]TXC86481.1 transcription factor [Paraburkholderia azotifigens]
MSVPSDAAVLSDSAHEPPFDDKMLRVSRSDFRSSFNLHSFQFEHTLHRTGLFDIPRIVELARRIIDSNSNRDFSALNFKRASIDAKFTAMPPGERLAETVARLGEMGTWIKLSRAQDYDREYAEVLDSITSELEDLSGLPLRKDITWATMTLFLASPKIATPFHIDHETNFLFQVQGSKDVCLFPASDRELVPDQEVERFYNGNAEAARYREDMQNRGTVYRLTPGQVVHHPPLAPHWVQNDDNISVSVSVGYCMKPLEERARVYQANYILRTMGLKPSPPGLSAWRDSLKRTVISTFEHRDPKSYYDIVFAPMTRLKSPLNAVRRLVGR